MNGRAQRRRRASAGASARAYSLMSTAMACLKEVMEHPRLGPLVAQWLSFFRAAAYIRAQPWGSLYAPTTTRRAEERRATTATFALDTSSSTEAYKRHAVAIWRAMGGRGCCDDAMPKKELLAWLLDSATSAFACEHRLRGRLASVAKRRSLAELRGAALDLLRNPDRQLRRGRYQCYEDAGARVRWHTEQPSRLVSYVLGVHSPVLVADEDGEYVQVNT